MIGIDLGGTTFSLGSVDKQGSIARFHEAPTRGHEGPERLIPRLCDAVVASGAQAGAVGIGVPGTVKHGEGVCVYAPNIQGWNGLPVTQLLSERLNLPAFIINDANAAALAESRFGAGRNATQMLMLTLGTGVGSGLIVNGKLHVGAAERGAEVGHTTIDIRSPQGSAGNTGTLESVCGRDAIVWRALQKLGMGRMSLLPEVCDHDLTTMTPLHIAQAAQSGDELARQVWEETAVFLAVGIVNVVFTVDVERVVIGGGVAQAGDVLFEPLRRAVAARTSRLTFDVSQIVPAELGPKAGLIGAAQWAREQV